MRSLSSSKPASAPAPAPGIEAIGTGSAAPAFLEIAQIQTAFGVEGEVLARILTDFPGRFARLKRVFLGEEYTPYRVEHAKVRGGEVFLKLVGVNTPEESAKLRLKMVQVPITEAVPLPKGAYYHYQVLGLSVVTGDDQALGRVVEILSTGGNDVYVVRGEKSELLVPAIAEVVKQVDLAAGRMVVALLEGMEPVPVSTPAPRRVRPPQTKRQRAGKPAEKTAEAKPDEPKPGEPKPADSIPPEAGASGLEGAVQQQ
jgi:16S rRNA processing protein RimM